MYPSYYSQYSVNKMHSFIQIMSHRAMHSEYTYNSTIGYKQYV